jgi:hypothetical protein
VIAQSAYFQLRQTAARYTRMPVNVAFNDLGSIGTMPRCLHGVGIPWEHMWTTLPGLHGWLTDTQA